MERDAVAQGAVARRASTIPHVAAGHITVGELHARAVSLQGDAHVLFAESRQDAFGLLASEDGQWLLCGVADGLGSEPYSAFGAEAALQSGLVALEEQLMADQGHQLDHHEVLGRAADAVTARAEALGVLPRAVSTTLTLAGVAVTSGPEGRRCLLAAAGDSHALLLGSDAEWTYLTDCDGEHPSNIVETYLPGSLEGSVSLSTRAAPGEVLVLATDGLTIPLGDGETKLGRGLAERWLPRPRDLMPFAVDLTFKGHHDDRTAVAVWC